MLGLGEAPLFFGVSGLCGNFPSVPAAAAFPPLESFLSAAADARAPPSAAAVLARGLGEELRARERAALLGLVGFVGPPLRRGERVLLPPAPSLAPADAKTEPVTLFFMVSVLAGTV